MERSIPPAPLPGYARCEGCRHIFLGGLLRLAFSARWCLWCLEQRPGTPHGTLDAASCECRHLLR